MMRRGGCPFAEHIAHSVLFFSRNSSNHICDECIKTKLNESIKNQGHVFLMIKQVWFRKWLDFLYFTNDWLSLHLYVI